MSNSKFYLILLIVVCFVCSCDNYDPYFDCYCKIDNQSGKNATIVFWQFNDAFEYYYDEYGNLVSLYNKKDWQRASAEIENGNSHVFYSSELGYDYSGCISDDYYYHNTPYSNFDSISISFSDSTSLGFVPNDAQKFSPFIYCNNDVHQIDISHYMFTFKITEEMYLQAVKNKEEENK